MFELFIELFDIQELDYSVFKMRVNITYISQNPYLLILMVTCNKHSFSR